MMNNLMIMVIDDLKVVIERMVSSLEELPNVEFVLHGSNYQDGERLLNEIKVDVAILDINLPGK